MGLSELNDWSSANVSFSPKEPIMTHVGTHMDGWMDEWIPPVSQAISQLYSPVEMSGERPLDLASVFNGR